MDTCLPNTAVFPNSTFLIKCIMNWPYRCNSWTQMILEYVQLIMTRLRSCQEGTQGPVRVRLLSKGIARIWCSEEMSLLRKKRALQAPLWSAHHWAQRWAAHTRDQLLPRLLRQRRLLQQGTVTHLPRWHLRALDLVVGAQELQLQDPLLIRCRLLTPPKDPRRHRGRCHQFLNSFN